MYSISDIRVGTGYDVHRFADNRACIIGGVQIPFDKGLLGHSDADVLIHAVVDALLGASSLGDIGRLYPDNESKNKDISSRLILREVSARLAEAKWQIINIDSVVICEKPKISPYVDAMKKAMADDLSIDYDRISVKGKTTEKLGFTGREEGVAATASALICRI
ncbi:MAG TPA: 2-C-methyl-D-erythritol 2,4-cyclodiphosphate synthase [Spirochaetota bacterium]|nr:2-C-methyl-D-erythritol 2,4-cyclodiphosphate synthase [Spirochaetota bacterium]HOH36486.1 2-C-methyl-D-erythritol 2,4-cyclodiphosphate synthase [Spirochaetota bacterium]HPJ14005.1 2-C-methyl-D-erythritol 2,4-cyclodiphosphate synthase [Spirochaetota bacterium]